MSCLRKNRWCGSLPIKPYVLSNAICLGILCITSFSAFPTQLNQQVTSANLSEIGVMQRLLSSMYVRHQNQKAHRQITQRCAGCTAVTFLRPSKIGAACSRLVLARPSGQKILDAIPSSLSGCIFLVIPSRVHSELWSASKRWQTKLPQKFSLNEKLLLLSENFF